MVENARVPSAPPRRQAHQARAAATATTYILTETALFTAVSCSYTYILHYIDDQQQQGITTPSPRTSAAASSRPCKPGGYSEWSERMVCCLCALSRHPPGGPPPLPSRPTAPLCLAYVRMSVCVWRSESENVHQLVVSRPVVQLSSNLEKANPLPVLFKTNWF